MSDESWLTATLQNPLAVGQYVNNCSHGKLSGKFSENMFGLMDINYFEGDRENRKLILWGQQYCLKQAFRE